VAKPIDKLRAEIAKAGGMKSIKVGSKLYLFTESERARVLSMAHRESARSGHAIEDGGLRQWYEWRECRVPKPGGGTDYVWHNDGNRVKQELVLKTVERDGSARERLIRREWRKLQ